MNARDVKAVVVGAFWGLVASACGWLALDAFLFGIVVALVMWFLDSKEGD